MNVTELYGTYYFIESKEQANHIKRVCDELGIEHAMWEGCGYTANTTTAIITHDMGTDSSCKLLFVDDHEEDEDTMQECSNLKLLPLSKLLFVDEHKDTMEECSNLTWLNGDVLEYVDESGEYDGVEGRYVSFDAYSGYHVIMVNGGFHHAKSGDIRKPESAERKREEAIHKLSMELDAVRMNNSFSLSDYRHDIAVYLVDKGYKKGKK